MVRRSFEPLRAAPPSGFGDSSVMMGISSKSKAPRLFCPEMASPAKAGDRKSTRLNSSHANISYAVFCLKKKNDFHINPTGRFVIGVPLWDNALTGREITVYNFACSGTHGGRSVSDDGMTIGETSSFRNF